MTEEVFRVIEMIVILTLVICTGLFLRRKGLLDKGSTERLSRFVVDVAFPALVFASMLRSIDPKVLVQSWYLPLVGGFILAAGMGMGYLWTQLSMKDVEKPVRGSAAFVAGTPNWLFLPLPIAIALYGDLGERIVLLVNAGALLVFWSIGVGTVKGEMPDAASARSVILNPGLLATIMGIAAAILFPWAQELEQLDITKTGPGLGALSIIMQAIVFVGDVTVPLAMIVTGSMLAGGGAASAWNRRVIGIAAVRLAVFPLLVMLLLGMARMAGLHVHMAVGMTIIIISAMPVAVTCTIVAEKFNGDVDLVARAIFVSTILSVATVPALVWLSQAMGF